MLLLCVGSLVSDAVVKLMLQPLGTRLSPLIRCLFESCCCISLKYVSEVS